MVDGTNEPVWRPLIVDADRRAAVTAVIVEIVTAVEAWRRDHPRDFEDDADYATLRIYTSTDDMVPDPDDEAGSALSAAIAGLSDRHSPGLFGGAARIAFTVSHLSGGDDADTAIEAIERSLIRFLERPSDAYDLISGLVGIAVPALQRISEGRPSATSEPLMLAILEQLERMARPMPTGIAWHTSPTLLPKWQRDLAPDGYFNLGLAHGIPGVVAILARYIAAGVEVERARTLLEGALAYLRSVASPRTGSRYPTWLASKREEAEPRVAWCYGDPRRGGRRHVGGHCDGPGRLAGRGARPRPRHGGRSFEASQVVDAGLCHGAAGVAHLFNRLSQATGDAVLARAADTWFTRTLAMRNTEPVAGFPRWIPTDGQMGWIPPPVSSRGPQALPSRCTRRSRRSSRRGINCCSPISAAHRRTPMTMYCSGNAAGKTLVSSQPLAASRR